MSVDVVVCGKNGEVSPLLREQAVEKVQRVEKYAGDIRRVEIDFSETRNRRVRAPQTCEILVHLKGHLVKGQASAPDQHAALDLALDKVEQQLRRLHERRTRKKNSRRAKERGAAAGEEGEPGETAGEPIVADLTASSDGSDRGVPVIVKTKQFWVKPMDPEEAALQMELLGHDFFLFTSSENGRAAVIYRRRDGHLGLIEATG